MLAWKEKKYTPRLGAVKTPLVMFMPFPMLMEQAEKVKLPACWKPVSL